MVRTRHSRGSLDSRCPKNVKQEPPAGLEASPSPERRRKTRGGGRTTLEPLASAADREVSRTRNPAPPLTPLYKDSAWEGRDMEYPGSPFRSARSRHAATRSGREHRSRSLARRYNVEFTEIEVRRSGRKRKMVYDNFSNTWITTQIAHSGSRDQQEEGGGTPPSDSAKSEPEDPEQDQEKEEGDQEPATERSSRGDRILLTPPEDDGMDMYSRVKRIHRPAQRFGCAAKEPAAPARVRRFVAAADSSSGDSSSDDDVPGEDGTPGEEGPSNEVATHDGRTTRAKTARGETKVIKKYYLRENRREPEFYQDDSLPAPAPAGMREEERYGGHRWHHRRHRRRKNAVFNESTTDSSDGRSGGEDSFERRKSRSMQGFRNKCLPMNFSKGEANQRQASDRQRVGNSLADVDPMSIDKDVNFEMIGGLKDHIRDLKEMILLPLLYPEVFSSKNITPPKGVLFCGPPGTGKTLMARALANECSLGDRKVAFFMRKGADVLSKWVGESERQLRLLFDQAYQMRPSIIFFDEVDGLAPVRSSKQDYIHSSIVSTLLALMDGVDSRGEVIVVGATNRPDSIDPALRRPGRFDREFYFPLPPTESREQILRLQLAAWRPPVPSTTISWLARQTVGYCGADLKHLVTEAVLHALRQRYPQIYRSKQRLLINTDTIQVLPAHFRAAMARMTPAGQRDRAAERRHLPPAVRPLLAPALVTARATLRAAFPWGYKQDLEISRSEALLPRLLLAGGDGSCVTEYLAPALLHGLEDVRLFTYSSATAHADAAEPLHALAQLMSEAVRSTPSVLYLPRLDGLWRYLAERLGLREPVLDLLRDVPRRSPLLLLATCDTASLEDGSLPDEVLDLFSVSRGQRQLVAPPGVEERRKLFTRLFMKTAIMLKTRKPKMVEEELPVAPPPPPRQLGDDELRKIHRREERRLAELRIFLREMSGRLNRNRQFELFRQPVEEEDAPDYYSIIERPMDLDTIMTRIDQHRYEAAEDWLADVDLICTNALEYNPDTTEVGREIRHRACMLRDQAHKLIAEQLDSDFEEECKNIRRSRRERAESPSKFAPSYLVTPRLYQQQNMATTSGGSATNPCRPAEQPSSSCPAAPLTPRTRPARRRSRWSRGVVSKRPRRTESAATAPPPDTEEGLSGELDLTCSEEADAKRRRTEETGEPLHTLQMAGSGESVKAAPPDEDSGHGSTTAPPSDELLGKLTGHVQVDRSRLLSLCERTVSLTEHFSVARLEELHSRLTAVVRRFAYRRQRAQMLNEMEGLLPTHS